MIGSLKKTNRECRNTLYRFFLCLRLYIDFQYGLHERWLYYWLRVWAAQKVSRVNDSSAEVNIYNIGGPVKPYALKTWWGSVCLYVCISVCVYVCFVKWRDRVMNRERGCLSYVHYVCFFVCVGHIKMTTTTMTTWRHSQNTTRRMNYELTKKKYCIYNIHKHTHTVCVFTLKPV